MKILKRIKWGNITKLLIAAFLVISFIGMITCKPYTKENGNVCKGYKYAMQICSGDIDLE